MRHIRTELDHIVHQMSQLEKTCKGSFPTGAPDDFPTKLLATSLRTIAEVLLEFRMKDSVTTNYITENYL